MTLLLSGCTTIDFIPESDFQSKYDSYTKKNWEEVEIHFTRPDKRIDIQGTIQVRDFEGSGRVQDYIKSIKQEMYRRKMDGVWIHQTKVQSINDTIFQTMDTRGNITHSYQSQTDVKFWKGVAFRDRN